ncbi:MAG: AEC family transporter [Clostridia bacterium]|nr:AEC family transporter [Clostridia bacterium]
MENLIISFKVVAPLLILMLLGAFLLRIHIFDTATVKKMNGAVFRVFLPVLIFNNIYNSSIDDVKNITTALYIVVIVITMFLFSMLYVVLTEKDNKKRGVMVQGICRSNFVIFGLPICMSVCGGGVMGKVAVAVAIVVPVLNIFAVLSLEIFRGGKPNIKKILKGIITNPLIIASIIGIIVLVSGIKLPSIIENAVSDISKIATPLALVLLGASVNFCTVRGNLKQLITVIAGKLIVMPLVGFTIAAMLGIRGSDMALLIAAFASPTAVSSYPMAIEMGGDGDLAAQIVAFSTAICIITVFMWVFILKQLGLI